MSLKLDLFCLNDNNTVNVIDAATQSIDACFLRGYILWPSYLLFATFNAYILGFTNDLPRSFDSLKLKLLRVATSLIFIGILANIFAKYFLDVDSTTPVSPNGGAYLISAYIIIDLYQLFAFSLHTLILFNKDLFLIDNPLSLVLVYLALVAANLTNMINYFYLTWPIGFQTLSSYQKFFVIYTVAYNWLLVQNFLVLVFTYYNISDILKSRRAPALILNDADDMTRFESLRDRSDKIMITSMMVDELDPAAEEDEASYYSYLTFKWLRRLMQKGYQRKISQISDLCSLPNDLNIAPIFARFMAKYFKNANHNEYLSNPILNSNLLRDPDLVDKFSTRFEEDRLVTFEVNQASRSNLLKALLKSFGREFFLLGFLKFLNDCLSFSGPLLLNQLVQFVEIKSESLRDGVLYAIGLFVCTLAGCLLNIHFTNSLNKLCLRIRIALISLIYRKSLIVKLNELNKFSIGQVVNFMSIDNDSIVNAFPSFHAFWSLPLQISITLYLLYSQIGLSFLVGVAFVIVLIPINKFLSDYIGKVQTKLMSFKDERVKVS
jgi:hypothetical protein